MKTDQTILDNGLRVITCEMPHTESVTYGVWAAVGGRHEPKRLAGISHFIEHMLFKGTVRRTARQIGQEIESVGGYLNATTTQDHTLYYGAAPANYFRRLSGVLGDMVLSPRFAELDIKRERSVIGEEILMYEDEPSEMVQEGLWEDLWPGHALGRPLTGTLKSIASYGRPEFLDYRARHYHGGNVVVSAAGKVTHAEVVARTAALLGELPAGRRRRPTPAPELPKAPRLRTIRRDTQQTHVAFAVPACTLSDPDRHAVHLLNVLLAGNMSSRLFQDLREKRGLCYTISSGVSLYEDTGVIHFYVGLDQRNLEKSLTLIGRAFTRLRDEPVPAAELRRAKEFAIGSNRMSLERTSAQNSRIGYSALFYGDATPPEETHDVLRRQTAEDLQRVARRYLDPRQLTMTVVGPLDELSSADLGELAV
ncbi:MAG: pitrilysin family protein [Chthoniobacterales bacterium]